MTISQTKSDSTYSEQHRHDLLLRAARFEIRRRVAFPQLGGADLDDFAWQSADDALMSILRRLGRLPRGQPVHDLGL